MSLAKLPDYKTMYKAVLERDTSFEDIFVTAVKTTGIFCRPGCHAKTPKCVNIEFFNDSKQALSFGYRPCKVCRPMEPRGATPDWLKALLKEIEKHPEVKLKDQDLRVRGLDPARVRRWFNKHHGITFQAYTRAIRINRVFGLIKFKTDNKDKGTGKQSVIDTALASGYESLSGFHDAFKKLTGSSPGQSRNKQIVTITRVLTPLGPMFAGTTDKGICLLEFTDRRMLETQIARLTKLFKASFVPGQHPLFGELDKQLKAYFEGTLKQFSLPLDTPGTDFQQQVWQQLLEIPYGETRSYQQQAVAINNPKAVRAVAKTNGDNRVGIIIPCHRVIGKDGTLTGYGGGLWRKQHLLELEAGY